MHRSKLFRALVIGGSMTAATLSGCGEEKSSNPANTAGQNESVDASDSETNNSTDPIEDDNESTHSGTETETSDETEPSDASDPTDSSDAPDESDESSSEEEPSDTATQLTPCFCNSEPSCCEEVDGEQQAADGFECCWGTSC